MAQGKLRFLRHDAVVEIDRFAPATTVLDYLRLSERACGTKEGCNEGDCGACTVAIGEIEDGGLLYRPANACIMLLGQLHGKQLLTVEDLAKGDVLHPVQQAMVDHHGAQCGFCTPGIVMSLFTLYQQGGQPDRQQILDHLAGNLCRCTGYRPIVDAALSACGEKARENYAKRQPDTVAVLSGLDDGQDLLCGTEDKFFAAPASVESLAELYAAQPEATLVGGATDVGLWITKKLLPLPRLIYTGRARGMNDIRNRGDRLEIGAAVTYAGAFAELALLDADIGETMRRIGSKQVRGAGTIGGNIANGSPIGDMPPILIALDARLTLRHGLTERCLPIEDFFIAYGRQDRKAGEVLLRIDVPHLKAGERFRCSKLSKRFDQDISAVMAAVKLGIDGARITSARIAYGGMAATPRRARQAETLLVGAFLNQPGTWDKALAALAQDYQPITDMRASADYRLQAAQGLLRRALIEMADPTLPTRVLGQREAAE